MTIEKYLTQERTLVLEAETKKAALREMVNVFCRQNPTLNPDEIMHMLLKREDMLSSRITPGIALPHALLPDFGKPIIALGYSHSGIPWDSPSGEKVNIVILSLCGRDYGNEHVEMMADIAETLKIPGLPERIGAADNTAKIYEILKSPHNQKTPPLDPSAAQFCSLMLENAESILKQINAKAVMIIANSQLDWQFLQNRAQNNNKIILAINESSVAAPDNIIPENVLKIPGAGLDRDHKIKLALLYALTKRLCGREDTLVCLSGEPNSKALNILEVIDLHTEYDILLALRSEIDSGDVKSSVFYRVLQIASTLAHEGREGKPVGAIFILGDYLNVQRHCYQMVINPFRGYPENERNVLDPALEETLKEFSRVDGACLIRGDGIVMSIGSYIQTEEAAKALQSGLGARHAAGMAITMSTKAIAIVISESTRRISIYQHGKLIVSLDRAIE